MGSATAAIHGGATLLSHPARHIRWKIIAPYAILTLLIAAAGTYLTTRLVGGSLEERFDNQLAEASRVAADSLVRLERRHLESVRTISFTEGVATAASGADGEALRQLVYPLAANGAMQRVEVLDASGRRILGLRLVDAEALEYAALDSSEAADRSSWPSVQRGLTGQPDAFGDKYADVVATPDGYALVTAGPLYDGDQLVGVVVVGTLLDSYLPLIKGEALADVTLYAPDGELIATTFPGDVDAEGLALPADVAAADGSALQTANQLYGRDFAQLYTELELRGEPIGYIATALPQDFIFSAQSSTQLQMALLFAGATAVTLVVGWLIARMITVPVTRLVDTARAVSRGDLHARSHVDGADEIGVLGRTFDAMAERLQRQHLATIRALTSAIDARDPYTMGHSLRVGQLAVTIGAELGLPSQMLQHLEIGGYLHDIGKIGVRDAVLLKPGSLTRDERDVIERHPSIGLDILEHVELPPEVLEFVGGHHEKLDGSGYPGHLHDGEMSVVPRIAAVADIYDALTTDRPYRPGMSIERALSILHDEAADGKLDSSAIGALERVLPVWTDRVRAEPELRGFNANHREGVAA